MEITLQEAIENPQAVIDSLTYISYKFNRGHSPHITVEQWKKLFSNVAEMEELYQKEKELA